MTAANALNSMARSATSSGSSITRNQTSQGPDLLMCKTFCGFVNAPPWPMSNTKYFPPPRCLPPTTRIHTRCSCQPSLFCYQRSTQQRCVGRQLLRCLLAKSRRSAHGEGCADSRAVRGQRGVGCSVPGGPPRASAHCAAFFRQHAAG